MKPAEFPNELTQAAFRENELLARIERLTAENERLRATLGEIETVSNIAPADDRYGSLAVRMEKVWLLSRGHALHQQLTPQSEKPPHFREMRGIFKEEGK